MTVLRVRSSKFCCCIPARLGVIICAILGIAFGGVIAICGIEQYKRMGGDIQNKVAYAIQIVIYGLYALVSIIGLIGATAKDRRCVKAFYWILIIHVTFSIASGTFALYRFWVDASDTVRGCINGSIDETVVQSCQTGVDIMKGVLVGLFIFVWILEIWGCVIVKSYQYQLSDEETLRRDGLKVLY